MLSKLCKLAALVLFFSILSYQGAQAEDNLFCFDCPKASEADPSSPCEVAFAKADQAWQEKNDACKFEPTLDEQKWCRHKVSSRPKNTCAKEWAQERANEIVRNRKPASVEDCGSPKDGMEALICSTAELANLDRELERVYREKLASLKDEAARKKLMADQKDWLERNSRHCDVPKKAKDYNPDSDEGEYGNPLCLKERLTFRVGVLKNWAPDPVPPSKSVYIEISDDEIDPIIEKYVADIKDVIWPGKYLKDEKGKLLRNEYNQIVENPNIGKRGDPWPRMMTSKEKAVFLAYVFRRFKNKLSVYSHDKDDEGYEKCASLLERLKQAKGYTLIEPEIVTDNWEEIFEHIDLSHCRDPNQFIEDRPSGSCHPVMVQRPEDAEIFVPDRNVALYNLGGDGSHAYYSIYGENYMYERGQALSDQRCNKDDQGYDIKFQIFDLKECGGDSHGEGMFLNNGPVLSFIDMDGELLSLHVRGIYFNSNEKPSPYVRLEPIGNWYRNSCSFSVLEKRKWSNQSNKK